MENLLFGTAGIPNLTKPRKYINAFNDLISLGLGCMEVEFVRGVNMNLQTQEEVKKAISDMGFYLSAHGPYFINLNSPEQEKIDASVKRILDTARVAHNFGGYSITFHAAYYMKQPKDKVYDQVKIKLIEIVKTLKKENIKIWIRPETTGKATQWGDMDEIIRISNDVEMVLPCVDFSHLHARSVGEYNTYDEFAQILDDIGTKIGEHALKNFHAHIAGINYGPKGEKNHTPLEESDFNYKDLLKALKNFDVKGLIICESPNLEEDATLLKQTYDSI